MPRRESEGKECLTITFKGLCSRQPEPAVKFHLQLFQIEKQLVHLRRNMDSLGLNADHLGQMGDLLVEPSPMLSSMVVYTLVGSALGFQCYNSALNFVPAPEKYASEKRFKWRNVMTSFAHALISGSVAVYCLVMYPHLRADMFHATGVLPNLLIAFSSGYFLYDMADLLIYGHLASILPLLLHHVLVLVTFAYLYYEQYCIPCGVVALLVEINSIFLHGRQVAVMAGIDKSTPFFIALNSVNIGTYIFMRFGVIVYIMRFLVVNRFILPPVMLKIMTVIMVTMTVINIILFWRLLKSDVFPSQRNEKEREILTEN